MRRRRPPKDLLEGDRTAKVIQQHDYLISGHSFSLYSFLFPLCLIWVHTCGGGCKHWRFNIVDEGSVGLLNVLVCPVGVSSDDNGDNMKLLGFVCAL